MEIQIGNKAQEIVNDLTILLKSLNQKLIASKKKNNTKLIIFTII
jgi:predicted site-specific integrase-resolvase